jgi:hypothetical protein
MAKVRLVIDGHTAMDEDLGTWLSDPPAILRDQLAANATPKLYMRAVLLIVADAAMTSTDTTIVVTTDAGDWTMDVRRP